MSTARTRVSRAAESVATQRIAILYLRLSDGRDEDEGSTMAARERKLRARARSNGWAVGRVIVENDYSAGAGRHASAFKRRRIIRPDGTVVYRVWRPGFREALADLEAGRAHALLAEDLDRVCRDPRDLEDMIDVVERYGVEVDSLSGSLRLASDGDITMARVLTAMANKSSRDTGRRVSEARERQAVAGRNGGGPRPYGFQPGGIIVDPVEATIIRETAEQILAGVPLRAVARQLNERGTPTATGTKVIAGRSVPGRWTSTLLRDVLLKPRNAGILVHRGEEVGKLAGEPILPRDVWESVVSRLTDPEATVTWVDSRGKRRTVARGANPGRAPKWLGTAIFLCVCGAPVETGGTGPHKAPAYRCAGGPGEVHVRRQSQRVDEMVVKRVIARLSGVKALALLDKRADDGADLAGLRAEKTRLAERLNDLTTMFNLDEIDRAQLAAGTRDARARIERIDAALAPHTQRSPLEKLPVGESPEVVAAAWEHLSLAYRREIVRKLFVVVILPSGQRGSVFDESKVSIVPTQPARTRGRRSGTL